MSQGVEMDFQWMGRKRVAETREEGAMSAPLCVCMHAACVRVHDSACAGFFRAKSTSLDRITSQ